ncbi:hypothetical protein M9H77_01874 [Catharanthus roseus]|uniref:Uncharacterized protein n=1 Tax=Catharanthus roseus TaxID=4058 RepID=A0ACC0C6T3_CATRO|nr:hypothetical protein M9H77_01874 [Catharanthus roseus]
MDSTSVIGKASSYFIDALNLRMFTASQGINSITFLPENEILYQNYYEATPYLKLANFTTNKAILEAFRGHDFVHVIHFSLMQGLQWPSLIHALALRPEGPPLLRITGILSDRDSVGEIINANLAFRGVVASKLDDINPWLLQTSQGEAIVVNSILELHKLIGLNSIHGSPIELVLNWVRNLNPNVITIVEQEVDHNQAEFLDRFNEALFYYLTMFYSLEAYSTQPKKDLREL